jgi:hypothetical protein
LEGVLFGMLLKLPEPCYDWPLPLLQCFFAFAILINSLLTFCNASSVSLPAGMFHWSAIACCCAAATTWDSSETIGFIRCWCLKNTMSLILVTRVFVMYTLKYQ